MKNISAHLAWRYLQSSAHEKTTAVMVRICFVSVLIGSFSLALVSAVMQGFETAVHEKMQGIHSHITINDTTGSFEPEDMEATIQDVPGITATSPSITEYAVVHPGGDEHPPLVIMLKGIDPLKEPRVSSIAGKIVSPEHASVSIVLEEEQVLIGSSLARMLDVTVGDTVILSYTPSLSAKKGKISMSQYGVTIGGIFTTGIEDFDASALYMSLDHLQSLFKRTGVTTMNVALTPRTNKQSVIELLREKTNLDVSSWEERYPALVSALTLEKYAMFLIIALIALVASMNIVSLLFMQITQKRPDIAILKAMGMPDKQIVTIFTYLGIGIASIASITGLALAWGVSELLERHQLIKLPDIYYTSHLPAQMEWYIPVMVFAVVMLISLLATWIPVRRIRGINVAEVLRFEG